METLLPAGCSWGVAGVGRHQLPMAELAAMWGGNARVGLEDNIYVDKGVLAEGSAPLVARAVELCQRHGRHVATVDEARAMLGTPRSARSRSQSQQQPRPRPHQRRLRRIRICRRLPGNGAARSSADT